MGIVYWIPKAIETHSEYEILIAFSTTVVVQTRQIFMVYVHCLSCLIYQTPTAA